MENKWTPKARKDAKVKVLFKLDASKNSEKTLQPTNCRGISLLSCIGKTFERVIENRISEFWEHFQLLDDGQGGFRAKRNTDMHNFVLDGAILKGGSDLPVCFIDIAKAFPSVRRASILTALEDIGTSGPIWHVICYKRNAQRKPEPHCGGIRTLYKL